MANIYYKTHKLSTFKARNGLFSQFYIGKHTFHKSPIVGVRLSEAPKRNFNSFYIKIVWGIQIQCQTNHKSVLPGEKGDFSSSSSEKFLSQSSKMPIRPIRCLSRDLKMPEMDFSDHFT